MGSFGHEVLEVTRGGVEKHLLSSLIASFLCNSLVSRVGDGSDDPFTSGGNDADYIMIL